MAGGRAGMLKQKKGWIIFANTEHPGRSNLVAHLIIASHGKNGHLRDACRPFDQFPRRSNHFASLIASHGRNGCLRAARRLFDQLPSPDVASSNAMLAAYARNGCFQDAERLFNKMPCRVAASWNAIIVGYAKYGHLEKARHAFDSIPMATRDVISWTAMISAYAHNGHTQAALELFQNMMTVIISEEDRAVKPNRVTFITVLGACANMADLKQGKYVHACIVQCGLELDTVVGNALTNLYGECGQLGDARREFDKLRSCQDVISWNAMIAAYTRNGHGEEALGLFRQMSMERVTPDKITLVSTLSACGIAKDLNTGRVVHACAALHGVEGDLVVGNALVNMYGKCRNLKYARSTFERMSPRDVISWTAMVAAYAHNSQLVEAKRIFDTMPVRNVVSWNAMIAAYTHELQGKKALEMFQDMQRKAVKPNQITLIVVLEACASLVALRHGKMVHAYIVRDHVLVRDGVVGNALVDMYGKCGCLETASNVFRKMSQQSIVSWNALLAAYAQNGLGKEALRLLQEMNMEGVKPDDITFSSILSACSNAGLLDDGWCHFRSIYGDYGIIPKVDHYVPMIDLLGRSGQLREAEILIKNMPFEPPFEAQCVAWTSLLGACKVHGYIEGGACAAEYLQVFGHE